MSNPIHHPSPRRPIPVPSKGALRVLYQLAYISSGTAVGVGVLCAEERRRRTQVVQRIADNAKRIRQHPRYVANASAAAVREWAGEGEEELLFDGDVGKGPRRRRKNGNEEERRVGGQTFRPFAEQRHREHSAGYDREAVRGQDLPSAVEEEYDAVRSNTSRWKTRLHRPSGANQAGTASSSRDFRPPSRSDREKEHANLRPGEGKSKQPFAIGSIQAPGNSLRDQMPGRRRGTTLHRDAAEPASAQQTSSDHATAEHTRARQRCVDDPAARFGHSRRRSCEATPAGTDMNSTTSPASLQVPCHEPEKRCQMLLHGGFISEAVTVYVQYLALNGQQPSSNGLFDRLFDTALQEKMFRECTDLLRLRRKHPSYPSCSNRLILACGFHEQHHNLLLDLFCRGRRKMHHVLNLRSNHEACAILAVACSTDDALFRQYEHFYRFLPSAWREHVIDRRSHMLLRVTWRTTQNIDAVKSQFDSMVEHLEKQGHRKLLQLVESCMVDMYIEANRTEDAIDTIARMHSHGNQRDLVMCKAALAFAKGYDWSSAHQVLRIAGDTLDFMPNRACRAALRKLVFVYSQTHSASQTWRFVTYLHDKLHCLPKAGINAVLLESFVARGSISLIPKWLQTCKAAGWKCQIDSRLAAHLLNRYYVAHRPSHVLISWFCRNLTNLVPSFDPKAFFQLIEKSISFDLGGTYERNAVWQQEHARQRLDRLGTANDEIPSPGYEWNQELYFRHPDAAKNPPVDAGCDMHVKNDPPTMTEDRAADQEGDSILEEDEGLDATSDEDFQVRTSSRDFVHQMEVAISLHQYEKALWIYEKSLDGVGLPPSPQVLTLGVQASIKFHRSDDHALGLINCAEHSGINVSPAFVHVMKHRIRATDFEHGESVDRLHETVRYYYKKSGERGFQPTYQVGCTAADLLITHGHPMKGLSLLRDILRSSTQSQNPVNIVVMTVLIKGHFAVGNLLGVRRLVRTALRQDFLISPGFLRELKRGLKSLHPSAGRARREMLMCLEACRARRQEQAFEAKKIGKKLVATIAKCMHEETTVDIDLRAELDRELFGKGEEFVVGEAHFEQPVTQSPREKTPDPEARQRLLAQNRERVEQKIRQDFPPLEGNKRRVDDEAWQKQYRAFLRLPMVLEDGRHASFSYYDPKSDGRHLEQVLARKGREAETWDVGAGEEGVLRDAFAAGEMVEISEFGSPKEDGKGLA